MMYVAPIRYHVRSEERLGNLFDIAVLGMFFHSEWQSATKWA